MEHPMLIKGWTEQTKKFFVSHGKVYKANIAFEIFIPHNRRSHSFFLKI